MGEFIQEHPYLGASLCLFVLALGAIWRHGDLRRVLVLSGLLGAPLALYEAMFIPAYWDPVLVGRCVVAPEDLVFSFSTGVLAMAVALVLTRRRLQADLGAARVLKRYLSVSALALALVVTACALGVGVMLAVLLVAFGFLVWWNARRPGLLKIAAVGAVGFAALYGCLLWGVFAIWPHFLHQWNHAALCGVAPAGLPVEELAWAGLYGGGWPVFMAHVVGEPRAKTAYPPCSSQG